MFIGGRSWWLSGFFDSHMGRVKGDSMVKVWTIRSQKNTRHGQHATVTEQEGDVHAEQARESTRTTCTRSKQGKRRCS